MPRGAKKRQQIFLNVNNVKTFHTCCK